MIQEQSPKSRENLLKGYDLATIDIKNITIIPKDYVHQEKSAKKNSA
jgi:hypothetical protein